MCVVVLMRYITNKASSAVKAVKGRCTCARYICIMTNCVVAGARERRRCSDLSILYRVLRWPFSLYVLVVEREYEMMGN